MNDLQIRRLDVENVDELRQWYDVCVRSVRASRPDFVPKPFEEQVVDVVEGEPGADRSDLVAVTDGQVVGTVMVWLPIEDNLTTSYVLPDVAPEHRGHGVGRRLVEAAEQQIPAARTQVLGWTLCAAEEKDTHPDVRFALSRGYSVSTTETTRRLPWPADAERLRALRPRLEDGYRVETYLGGVPERYREGLGVLKGLVDVDAPSGDMEWEASPLTPEAYAVELSRHERAGRRVVESLALTENDEVVAYTELVVPSIPERAIVQEGTLVLDAHRGHRLGMAVKVANLLRLVEMDLPHPYVTTSSDDDNRHMVGINEQLGFRPDLVETIFVKRR